MSVTIQANPTAGDVAMCRSNIIYVITDAGLPPDLVAYNLEVFAWRGDITVRPVGADSYFLRRYPDPNNHSVFNISKILQGYFVDLDYALPVETTGDLTINFEVVASYWNGTINIGASTGGILQAQIGYSYYTQDVNFSIPQQDDGWLTDMPHVNQPDNGRVSLFIRNRASSAATQIIIEFTDATTASIPITTGAPTVNEETLLNFKVGRQDLIDAAIALPTDDYKVYPADGGGAPLGAEIPFYLHPDCKYAEHKIDYLNRYGVWDRIYTWGNTRQAFEYSGDSAQRNSTFDYDQQDAWKQGDGQFVMFNKDGRDTIVLNTGWIDESFNEPIKQMFLAERVVVDGFSAVLTEKRFQYKTRLTEKLINYEFTFEFAFTSINTIK